MTAMFTGAVHVTLVDLTTIAILRITGQNCVQVISGQQMIQVVPVAFKRGPRRMVNQESADSITRYFPSQSREFLLC